MPLDLIGYITQSQFRHLLAASKVLGPQLAADAADDAFLQATQSFKVMAFPATIAAVMPDRGKASRHRLLSLLPPPHRDSVHGRH